MTMRRGLLLINLGTPLSTSVGDVRRYLREFLMDPMVIDIPAAARFLLVNGIIAPFRAPKSAEAYRQIWTEAGSPLLTHSEALTRKMSERLADRFDSVALAMRYQEPSISQALEQMRAETLGELTILPLFPQYSTAAWGSAVAAIQAELGRRWNIPAVKIVPPFFAEKSFIEAFADVCQRSLKDRPFDKLLFSFHGLPERHCQKSHPDWCFKQPDCCETVRAENAFCYRAQCVATAKLIATEMQLKEEQWEICFQSRLGRAVWIRPYTDVRLSELAAEGVKRVAIACPAFVADCLETLEEIDMRAREQFIEEGGEDLVFIPSLNSSPLWCDAVEKLVAF